MQLVSHSVVISWLHNIYNHGVHSVCVVWVVYNLPYLQYHFYIISSDTLCMPLLMLHRRPLKWYSCERDKMTALAYLNTW